MPLKALCPRHISSPERHGKVCKCGWRCCKPVVAGSGHILRVIISQVLLKRSHRPMGLVKLPAHTYGMQCSCLMAQDAVLGPWPPGRDPLGDALAAFAGAPGGPTVLPWQAGLLYSTDPSPGEGSPCLEEPAFPQPQALGAALLAAQLRLLGSLLAAVSPANQVHSECWPYSRAVSGVRGRYVIS